MPKTLSLYEQKVAAVVELLRHSGPFTGPFYRPLPESQAQRLTEAEQDAHMAAQVDAWRLPRAEGRMTMAQRLIE